MPGATDVCCACVLPATLTLDAEAQTVTSNHLSSFGLVPLAFLSNISQMRVTGKFARVTKAGQDQKLKLFDVFLNSDTVVYL